MQLGLFTLLALSYSGPQSLKYLRELYFFLRHRSIVYWFFETQFFDGVRLPGATACADCSSGFYASLNGMDSRYLRQKESQDSRNKTVKGIKLFLIFDVQCTTFLLIPASASVDKMFQLSCRNLLRYKVLVFFFSACALTEWPRSFEGRFYLYCCLFMSNSKWELYTF